MQNLAELSTTELVRLAEDYELLDDFDRQGSRIKLRQGSLELCFAEGEARLFIRGLIRGRERVLAISRSRGGIAVAATDDPAV